MRKRRTLLLLSFVLIGLVSVRAQSSRLFIGVKGGLGIPNLTAGSKTTPLSEGYASRTGFYGGVLGEFHTSKLFALRVEINYSSQGGVRKGMQALPLNSQLAQFWQALPNFGITPGDYMYAHIKSEALLDYLEIPILAKFTFALGSKINFYMQAGPYMGFLLHAKNVTSGSSPIFIDKAGNQPIDTYLQMAQLPAMGALSFDHTQDITSDINRFNMGGQGIVGFELGMGSGKLFIEGGGNYGFIPIQKDDANGTNHTGAGTVTVGYLFGLK
jgi:hypothetical protein